MTKITMADGSTLEGTPAELAEFMLAMAVSGVAPAEHALKVGDHVKVLADGECGGVAPGEYGVIEEPIDDDGQFKVVGEDSYDWFYPTQLEKVAEQDKPAEHTFKVGDYVKVVDASGRHSGIVEGQIRIIVGKDDTSAPYDAELLDGSDHDWFKAYRLVKATEAEVAAAKTPKEPALKVGDYAKVTRDVHEHREGDIALITEKRSGVFDFQVDRIGKGTHGFINAKNIVKATDAEVAEVKAKAAEATKWAKLGRKVNEFRKGDIVVSTGDFNGHAKGVYGVIKKDDDSGIPSVEGFSGKYAGETKWARVDLVAPIEARFDRN